jgi:hypothetical protein
VEKRTEILWHVLKNLIIIFFDRICEIWSLGGGGTGVLYVWVCMHACVCVCVCVCVYIYIWIPYPTILKLQPLVSHSMTNCLANVLFISTHFVQSTELLEH